METENVSRSAIVERLVEELSGCKFVLAAWLGGSEATGRTDEWSDIDMQILCEDGEAESTFAAIHRGAESFGPIVHRWRLQEPTWHGHSQEFSRVHGAGNLADLDIVVLQRSTPGRFLEPERHGQPVVLFDREGLVQPEAFDRLPHHKRMATRLATMRDQVPLCQAILIKAIRRGLPAEALSCYLRFALSPLVELWRMRHSPDVFDFGLRYLDRDLPADLRSKIEGWSLPGSLKQMETFRVEIELEFAGCLAELDRGSWKMPSTCETR
ncbi:MAG: hypothetical protein P1V35_01405 [Planctomycetota bacterium]|nr:hypothetical protein [Planctomycetota bacterium]